eukprot:6192923-Pleurochrysis_carterae.AAC.1
MSPPRRTSTETPASCPLTACARPLSPRELLAAPSELVGRLERIRRAGSERRCKGEARGAAREKGTREGRRGRGRRGDKGRGRRARREGRKCCEDRKGEGWQGVVREAVQQRSLSQTGRCPFRLAAAATLKGPHRSAPPRAPLVRHL